MDVAGIGRYYPPDSITHWAELTEIKIEGLEENKLKIPKVFENQWVKFKYDGVVSIGKIWFDDGYNDEWCISGVDTNSAIFDIVFNDPNVTDVELLRV